MKIYPGGSEDAVRILPKLDRLLLFWSDRRNPHEVEPSHDVRLADILNIMLTRFAELLELFVVVKYYGLYQYLVNPFTPKSGKFKTDDFN